MKRIAIVLGGFAVLVTALHMWLNVDWSAVLNERLPPDQRKLNVAYIPVT
jgi:NitT/TauT family transport system substrate-binding protein